MMVLANFLEQFVIITSISVGLFTAQHVGSWTVENVHEIVQLHSRTRFRISIKLDFASDIL